MKSNEKSNGNEIYKNDNIDCENDLSKTDDFINTETFSKILGLCLKYTYMKTKCQILN